ncbi:hypothetical protein EM20IM_00185 [Candidatus Methylacidiphilum infernorum]|uniref:Uncharacterized protein n=1 Tax=Candidatus Methylacidiphilum infernorum TaxID=511746 RepID=A0ABX7PW62_9BACT|nr:hypothetical protein [Candidatus Methylacidiphilum infernorum]QSR86829.1 hypothetical protein EM20IM_00185 [Candidatus Methylacidiphilum infernorum]
MAQNFPFRKSLAGNLNELKSRQPFPQNSGSIPHSPSPFASKNPSHFSSEATQTSSSSLIYIHTPFIPKSSLHSPLAYPQSFSFPHQSPFPVVPDEKKDGSQHQNQASSSFKVGNSPLNPLSQQPFQKTNLTFSFQKPEPKQKEENPPFLQSQTNPSSIPKNPFTFPPTPVPQGKNRDSVIPMNSAFAPSEGDPKNQEESVGRSSQEKSQSIPDRKKEKKQPSSRSSSLSASDQKEDDKIEEPAPRSNRLLLGLTALVSILTATYFVLVYYDIF